MSHSTWQTVAQQKQHELLESIPMEWRLPASITSPISVESNNDVLNIPVSCGTLTPKDIDITENYSAVSLVDQMTRGELSCLEVTTAFCKRAAVAHQLVNCCTALLIPSALARAKECDNHLQRTGKPLGPLHGLPISVKDLFDIPGAQTTAGFIAHASDSPKTEARGLTKMLLDLGAVLYVKTNMSQMGFAFDTDNNLFGRTLNPLRTSLTPGGSSGGESALLALRGSVLGVGTDALGSLRVPAHATGVYALKPSPQRVPYGGLQMRSPGVPGLPLHVGPLARCVEDLQMFIKAVAEAEPWEDDATVLSVPWKEATIKSKHVLRIGCIVEDSAHPLHPPMFRTMLRAIEKVEKAGHTIGKLHPGVNFPSLAATAPLALRFAMMDPESTAFKTTLQAGEPLVPSVANALPSAEVRKQLAPSLESLIQANAEREKLAEEVLDVFVSNQLDAIMMPLHETAAPPVDTWNTGTYIAIWNLLPYPVVNMPFGRAEEDRDAEFGVGRQNVKLRTQYVPEQVEGMPCSLQIVGRTLRDEELLGISSMLATVLNRTDSG